MQTKQSSIYQPGLRNPREHGSAGAQLPERNHRRQKNRRIGLLEYVENSSEKGGAQNADFGPLYD